MDIRYLKGALTILAAVAAPFGAWAMAETSLRAAIVLGIVAGLGAAHNWLDTAFSGSGQLSSPSADAPVMLQAPALPPTGETVAPHLLPHAEAHGASKHSEATPAVPAQPNDVREGSA